MSKKIKLSKFKQDDKNFNIHTEKGMELLGKSIEKAGVIESITVSSDDKVISGNARQTKMQEIFQDVEPIVVETDGTRPVILKRTDISSGTKEFHEAALLANTVAKHNINLDTDLIQEIAVEEYGIDVEELGVEELGFDEDFSNSDDGEDLPLKNKKLEERFLIPPFSILDAKSGRWQQRKNWWLAKGIKSEESREDVKLFSKSMQPPHMYELRNKMTKENNGVVPNWGDVIAEAKILGVYVAQTVNIFDPVLCEVVYRWFNIDEGKILDPFAGGSVRGIVAAYLGYEYIGNDLRREQIEANRINAKEVLKDNEIYPVWTIGDSTEIDELAKEYEADLIFSCPPYADLEVYSDDPSDISNMDYSEFLNAYQTIITKSCEKLKQDRFAVFVVGDVRDKKGFYRNFVSDTIQCFINAGLNLYNEIILATPPTSVATVCGNFLNATRKVGKTHQNVLVFYKGNPKNIRNNFKELDLSYLQDDFNNENNL